MSANKHPQQPLKNNQKPEDTDRNGTDGSLNPPSYPLINTLNRFERNEALKQLASQISRVCSSSSNSDDPMTFPLEDLPNTLQLLAELAIEAKANDSNREEKSKILHLAAVMLRRVLHMPEANHYRVLGLDSGATATQIAEHYRLLHELFWFDGTIDPKQKSRLRIFEAYTALKESESRQRYDEEQKLFEQLEESSSGRSGLWRVAAVALPVILGLSIIMFYLEKSPDIEMASLQEKSPDSYAVINENAEPDKSDVTETPIKESLQLEVETIQQHPTQPTDTVFLPEEVPEVIHAIEENTASKKAYVAEIQVDDNVQLPDIIPKPPLDMVSTETPYIEKPERVVPQIKEPIQVKQAERQVPPVVSSLPGNSFPESEIEAEPESTTPIVDAELLMPNLLPKPSLLNVTSTEASPLEAEPARIEEPLQQKKTTIQQRPSVSSNNSASRLAASVESTMVVIGSPNLEISRLTKEQVKKLFLGEMAMLPRWQGVEIFDQQDGNKVKHEFYRAITNKTPMQVKAHWVKLQFGGLIRPPEALKNDQAIMERVATSRSAIGYINRASLDNSVKVLLGL